MIFYNILLYLLSPFIYLFYIFRILKKKETFFSFKQKFCFYNKIENIDRSKKLIWIHAVSIGELNSIWNLVKKLNDINKYNILVTTSTITSCEIFKNHIKKLDNTENLFYAFFPIDVKCIVKKFLNIWKPDLFLNVESEIWPNVLVETRKVCKIIGINTKISEKSMSFWMKHKTLKNEIFSKFDVCFAQSPNDLERLKKLNIKSCEYFGNLKFCIEEPKIDLELLKKFEYIKDRKNKWLINSTHKGEEEIFIESHKKLKNDFPDLLTCLVIRHSNRRDEVIELLKKNNIKFASFQNNDKIEDDTELFLYDKIGGLTTLFELFKIVFMAGSLIDGIGGHTPIEAAKQKCCTLTGPYVANNKLLFNELVAVDGSIILKNSSANDIYKKVKYLLNNEKIVKTIGENGYKKIDEFSIALDNIINKIEEYLK